MHHKKPLPPLTPASKARRLCPVCHTVSYSIGGIHPQCAEKQAGVLQSERLKASREAEGPREPVVSPVVLGPWQKLCPKCRTPLHTRKPTCDCGHRFSWGGSTWQRASGQDSRERMSPPRDGSPDRG